MDKGPTLEDLTPEVDASVRTSLDRILASKAFLGSERLRRFLHFIVEQRLRGEAEKIKEYVVAVEVFDKDSSFDSRVDPIVRVEAGRLRSKLREYYETEGQADRIRFDLPKGGYVPVFEFRNGQVNGRELVDESVLLQQPSEALLPSGNGSAPQHKGLPEELGLDPSNIEEGFRPEAHSPSARAKQKFRQRRAAFAVGFLMLAAGSAYWLTRSTDTKTLEAPLVVPFTTFPGSEGDPSFSPDGNQVAFSWNGEGSDNMDIYIKQVGTSSPRRLTSDPRHDFSPAWSPDGQAIAFVRDVGSGKSALMAVDVNGGRERLVAELPTQKVPLKCRWICWHPGGKWLAVASDVESRNGSSAIYLLSTETAERRRLTSPPEGSNAALRGDTNPVFSADGRSLVFVRFAGLGTSEIFSLRLTEGLSAEREPRQLTFSDQWTVTPTWMPDGKRILFASGSHIHSANLWEISISDAGKPKPVSVSGQGLVVDPVVSPAAHRLVYRSYSMQINIWRNQILREKQIPVPPSKFMGSNMVQEAGQYSPNGNAVAFISYSSGSGEIWIADSDGSNPSQLTHLGGPRPNGLRWSPDGQHIVFGRPSNGKMNLYSVSAQGGQVRRLTHTPFNDLSASYSRDGRWLYFASDRNGDFQVWKMPADGGDALQITRKGGGNPLESVNGKELYYLKLTDFDFADLWKMPVDGIDETRVLTGVLRTNFDLKEKGIYYAVQPDRKQTQFLFYDFASGNSKSLCTIQRYVGWGFCVSPDEKWILSTQSEGTRGSDLVLVENFR